MNVLIIGQGGREHALVRALRLSPSVTEIHALPGNDGMGREAQCHKIDFKKFDDVVGLVKSKNIELVIIGPEGPLELGLSDHLRENGILVFAPDRAAARLENSKVFSKDFMIEFGVPTAKSVIVKTIDDTLKACSDFTPPYVLKADGLAAGKGVFICKTKDELKEAAKKTFEDRIFGNAGNQALLEQFTPGFEISYLVLTNGRDYQALPLSQDHKRLLDGDEGPNTGGMGTVAPVKIDQKLEEKFRTHVMKPILRGLTESKFVYRGVLFIGLMITKNSQGELEPSVLEFNTRFGDPETQVLLPLLDGDWGSVFKSVAEGELPKLSWKNEAAACVVLAAEGYPDSPRNGVSIKGVSHDSSLGRDQYVLHAGTLNEDHGTFVTNGGRVLNIIGVGRDMKDAIAKAYAQIENISWPGMQFRKDIGEKS